jgi:hypothetical protein
VRKTDLYKLTEAYSKIINEDLGLGPVAETGTTVSMGLEMPNSISDYEKEASEMAESDLESILDNVTKILNQLKNSKIEPWVASKITLAADYINTVQERIKYKS